MDFQPDYRHFAAVMRNERPARLPFYDHYFAPNVVEAITGVPYADLLGGDAADRAEYFRRYIDFLRAMTFDVVIWEVCSGDTLPSPSALYGGQGPIQTRADLEAYPWGELAALYWRHAAPYFDALRATLPPGMKAVGGVGNGVFELAETLVGLEYLPFIQTDDPELYDALFARIGDYLVELWSEFLPRYGDCFVAARIGDDLGYKASLLTNPRTVLDQVLPQYRRLIQTIHAAGLPFLWHSCGCIFEVMDEFIAAGINAKHSNEDIIAPFQTWIDRYGDRIGLLGGIDMDLLCTAAPAELETIVLERGRAWRASARGWALGSGNSIPHYVPPDNYLALIRGGQRLRAEG